MKSGKKKIEKNVVELKGKEIKYKNIPDLSFKLNITRKQASELINENEINKLILNKNGDIARINIKQKPLILRQFGIKNVANKKLFMDTNIKQNIYSSSIGQNNEVNLIINIKMTFKVSGDDKNKDKYITRWTTINGKFIVSEINDKIEEAVKNYIDSIPDAVLIRVEPHIISSYSQQELKYENMQLRELEPLKVTHFTNIDQNININNCVRDYLKLKLKKISQKTINNLGDKNGVTCQEIINFCTKYHIKYMIYKINTSILFKSEYKRNKSYAPLIFIAYNNHLYPIKNKYLEKINDKEINNIEIVKSGDDKLKSFIENGILPYDINIRFNYENDNDKINNILSFKVNNTKYICNDEYNQCLNILKKYGLEHEITDDIKIRKLLEILSKLYVQSNIVSFCPAIEQFTKGGFLYKNDIQVNKKDLITIDKVKCYSHSLKSLPYLLTCDYRTAKITKNPIEIIDHYLYNVNPKQSSILLPDTNLYTGYHLKYAQTQDLEFELLEEIECNKVPNYYSKLVEDLFINVDNNEFKNILNCGIGMFEKNTNSYLKYITEGLFNQEETKCNSGFSIPINDNYNIIYNTEEQISNSYTKKIIAFQVKDMSRQIIYQKLLDLNLQPENIIQIKTDSITYIGDKPKDLDFGLDGWKEEQYNELSNVNEIINKPLSLFFKYPSENKKRVLYDCYAGCGKTYDIINEIIPELRKQNKKFIVLTPSHSSIEEYRKLNINCKVIQTFSFKNSIPNEDFIIIDEIGMCDKQANDVLYKCFKADKEFMVYGDFKQLLPVFEKSSYNSEQYLNLLFNEKKELCTNHRNNFSKEYYDNLINNKINLRDEVLKYSNTGYIDAEVIICCRKDTRDKYNKLMMEYLGLNDLDIGLKLICITNDLQHKNIYNNFAEEIIDVNKDNIQLSNGESYTKEEIKNNFRPAYARTAYSVQGKSLKSFYYPIEDYDCLNGRLTYTIISRLKIQ